MNATGIVRRIDDLGRIVIPKEIRRTLKIREGDPPEIFIVHNFTSPFFGEDISFYIKSILPSSSFEKSLDKTKILLYSMLL